MRKSSGARRAASLATLQTVRRDFRFAASLAEPSLRLDWKANALLADTLQRFGDGEIRRLLVMTPPRIGKSTQVAQLLPAWLMVRRPGTTIGMGTHSEKLAKRNSRMARRYLREMGGEVSRETGAVLDWETTDGSRMWGVGSHGSPTGDGADVLLGDDLVSGREQADSPAQMETLLEWLREDFWSRLESGGQACFIGTRWTERDPIGFLLDLCGRDPALPGWHVLMLDQEYDPEDRDFPPSCRLLQDWRTEPGELLAPERWDEAALREVRAVLGARGYSALHQQRPRPKEGLMFRRADFGRVDAVPADAVRVRAWDLAASDDARADRTAGVLLARLGHGLEARWVVEDVISGRWGPGRRNEIIRRAAEADGRRVRQVIEQEPGSGGKAQAQQLVALVAPAPGKAVAPTGDKRTRAIGFAAQVEAGNVSLRRAPWNDGYLDELEGFPASSHDDRVDATSAAFNWLAAKRAGLTLEQMMG